MKKPDYPASEDTRLETLMALNILDTPPEERFDRLTRMAKRTFDVSMALVSLVDRDRQWFKSSCGLQASETARDISFCGHAICSDDQVYIICDASKDPRFADNPLVIGEPYIRFYAGVPLRAVNGEKLGTFCIIDTGPKNLDANDIEALCDLALMAERELSIVQLATVDDLTRIPNRRGFMVLANNILPYCSRHQVPACLMYFDLNSFKEINDTHGHAEGDQVLKVFANALQDTIRESDVIGRLGGDEFVCLLSNTDKSKAELVADRLKHLVKEHCRCINLHYELTFSYGVVEYDPMNSENLETLLHEADVLMYENKKKLKQNKNN